MLLDTRSCGVWRHPKNTTLIDISETSKALSPTLPTPLLLRSSKFKALSLWQDKGVFPLKIREGLILEANNFLRKKGLFPEDDGDDDDECVFGDDDFPS